MKMKRHSKILDIIQNESVETQEALAERLKQAGYNVTQATVSRDIKELRLLKVQGEDGAYRYVAGVSENKPETPPKYRTILLEAVLSVDYSGNIVVVKCHTGMGNAAAAILDSLHWPSVVGSIAGDDTIMFVMRSEEASVKFAAELTKIIR
ncbi:arginine repressor [Feifania hominis]|uniref:Arginine repressor n=1 Tax=Feifania hominis TaxID=2763660 RepID=A0A926DD07_9FIRM|nr:arginine repressor [Feifania hominis]MBC8535554.1 arginine repressor [Feifania hominis]